MKKIFQIPFFIRLTHWEYWPFFMVYSPLFPIFLIYFLKARSFFYFSAANPSIQNGGFLMESKKDIYDLIPPAYIPKTLFFKVGTLFSQVEEELLKSGLTYPLIAKPDIGMKGMGVARLETARQLQDYVQVAPVNFLVQEWISYPKEAGIFYCSIPGSEQAKITGIVAKEFLSITGDGYSSIRQLIFNNPRGLLQLKALRKEWNYRWNDIPAKGEKLTLVPYGNHARGSLFLDHSHLVDRELEETIHSVCKQIKGFHFGRLDIRYANWADLKMGKNFSIIELNGSGSEPTHIYDPSNSLFTAWREILRHWKLMYRVSRANHALGQPYLSFGNGIKMIRDHWKHQKLLRKFQ